MSDGGKASSLRDPARKREARSYVVLLALLGSLAWAGRQQAPVLGMLWLAVALAVAWPRLVSWGRSLRLSRTAELAIAALVLLVVTWGLWRHVYAAGRFADTKDHHIMLERARELARSLQTGHIQHYTHFLQGGDALWDLYPVLPGVAAALIDSILPGDPPFEAAYTAVVVGSYWLRGLAVYTLGRSVASRYSAALLTAASLLDVGSGVWDGTWAATIHWGLVHSNLGISFAALALAIAGTSLRTRRISALWLSAGCTCAALMSHPLALIYLGVTLSTTWLAGLSERIRPQRLLWYGGGVALGCTLAGWWFVPYSTGLKALGVRFPWPGEDFATLGGGLLTGQRPLGDFGGFHGFVLLACLAALLTRDRASRSRNVLLRGYSLGSLLLFCLVLSPFAISLQAFELLPSLLGIQPARLFMVLKVSVVPVAAWALDRLFSELGNRSSLALWPTLQRSLLALLLLFGIGPALDSALGGLRVKLQSQAVMGSLADPLPPHGSEVDDDLAKVMRYLGEVRSRETSKTPFRMLTRWASWEQWGLWWFPWRIKVPMVLMDPLPGNFMAIRPQHLTLECLREWNVRFMVQQDAEDGSPVALAGVTERFASGRYHVYEVADYDDRFVVPVSREQDVHISDLTVEGDRIRFEVSGASEPLPVRIRAAWFPRWRAVQDGAPVAVSALPAHTDPSGDDYQGHEAQLALEVRNGVVELRCDGPMPHQRTGQALTWLGLAAGLATSFRPIRLGALKQARRGVACATGWSRVMRRRGLKKVRVAAAFVASLILGFFLFKLALSGRSDRLRLGGPLPNDATWLSHSRGGATSPCRRGWLRSNFHCTFGTEAVQVSPRMGFTRGYRGEFAQVWPGVSIRLPAAGDELVIDAPMLRGRSQLLVRYNTSAPTTFELWQGSSKLKEHHAPAEWSKLNIDLPDQDSGVRLVLRATQAASTVTFDARLVTPTNLSDEPEH